MLGCLRAPLSPVNVSKEFGPAVVLGRVAPSDLRLLDGAIHGCFLWEIQR